MFTSFIRSSNTSGLRYSNLTGWIPCTLRVLCDTVQQLPKFSNSDNLYYVSLKLTRPKIFAILTTLTVFLFLLYPPTDSDLGWHLKYGEYFLQNKQILRQDIFSHTFQGYPWINHSWLFDILAYLSFAQLRFLGLSILGALIVFAALKTILKSVKASPLETLLSASIFIFFAKNSLEVGIRSQFLSWLGLSVLLFLLNKYKKGQAKALLFLPLLFLFWANFHGTFLLGLAVLGIFWLVEIAKSFRPDLSLACLTSATVTLLNPFGFHICQEAFKHFGSPLLQTVYEWKPVDLSAPTGIIFVIFAGIMITKALFDKKEDNTHQVAILTALLFLAFTKRRFVPLFVLASLPVFVQITRKATKLLKSEWVESITYMTVIIAFLYASFIRSPRLNLFSFSWNSFCLDGPKPIGCSEEAVKFLKLNPPEGKMFNLYRWGGYLVWRLPEKKVFIDGRMHLWQKDSRKIIEDYGQIFEAKPGWEEKLEKYDVSWIFVPGLSPLHLAVWHHPHWQQVYDDPFSVIFVRSVDSYQ